MRFPPTVSRPATPGSPPGFPTTTSVPGLPCALGVPEVLATNLRGWGPGRGVAAAQPHGNSSCQTPGAPHEWEEAGAAQGCHCHARREMGRSPQGARRDRRLTHMATCGCCLFHVHSRTYPLRSNNAPRNGSARPKPAPHSKCPRWGLPQAGHPRRISPGRDPPRKGLP